MSVFDLITNRIRKPMPDRADYICEECGERSEAETTNWIGDKHVCRECLNEEVNR